MTWLGHQEVSCRAGGSSQPVAALRSMLPHEQHSLQVRPKARQDSSNKEGALLVQTQGLAPEPVLRYIADAKVPRSKEKKRGFVPSIKLSPPAINSSLYFPAISGPVSCSDPILLQPAC